jgi:hypothetical protein
MNYDQRIAYIKQWFKDQILPRFNMPRDLDPRIVAMDVIEAVNNNIPSKTDEKRMGYFVALIAKEISRSARSRTLPPVKEFVDATRAATQGHGEARSEPTSKFANPYLITEKRIRSGEEISDLYLRGTMREQLIAQTSITDKDLEPYELTLDGVNW